MRMFPILIDYKLKKYNGVREVSWDFVETARSQIEYNHGQTLERLAERGGLCWCELLLGLTHKKINFTEKIDNEMCHKEVIRLLKEWTDKQTI